MKKISIALFSIFSVFLFSQIPTTTDISEKERSIRLKANGVFLPIGILNIGIEKQISEKHTLQAEVFLSPWKSFAGKKLLIAMVGLDGRYYFSEAFKKWYVGLNISAMAYNMQKYNYWNDAPYQLTEQSPIYVTSDLYQKGFSVMAGAVIGYQWPISEKWSLDFYAGAGTVQSYYKGFHKDLGIRYDEQTGYNKSGEILPYKGGIMISYTLK